MKHIDHLETTNALPDAPLAMPKQVLERPRARLFGWVRAVFTPFASL